MITQEELDEILTTGTFEPDPNKEYSVAELDEIATALLRADVRAGNKIDSKNPVLFKEHLRSRYRREIYNKEGTPDPAFGHGIYNRTHPEGRKVNSEEQRKTNGASYYR